MTGMSEIAKNFEPQFEYAFSIALELTGLRWLNTSSTGMTRAAIYVSEGVIEGPGISGKVVPMSGGDWPLKRADGVLDFDARYLLEMDDGTTIYMQNKGYRWAHSEEIAEKMANGEDVDHSDYYMRVTPKFDAPDGEFDWMNRHVFLGVAEKIPGANRIHYFKVL